MTKTISKKLKITDKDISESWTEKFNGENHLKTIKENKERDALQKKNQPGLSIPESLEWFEKQYLAAPQTMGIEIIQQQVLFKKTVMAVKEIQQILEKLLKEK